MIFIEVGNQFQAAIESISASQDVRAVVLTGIIYFYTILYNL